jgi:hypothetical protein
LLRLRAYDKLHNLVSCGAVKKNGKIFTGNSAALGAMAMMSARRSAPPSPCSETVSNEAS